MISAMHSDLRLRLVGVVIVATASAACTSSQAAPVSIPADARDALSACDSGWVRVKLDEEGRVEDVMPRYPRSTSVRRRGGVMAVKRQNERAACAERALAGKPIAEPGEPRVTRLRVP
ncbi:MAG: hypothetical protein ACODAG_01025 [Myxococcota bacterium]